jgi:tetratricopeptide (TPR) repeat protein
MREISGNPAAAALASLAVALAISSCSGAGSSSVTPTRAARVEVEEHLRRGTEMMRIGQDDAAIAEFRRSIALDRTDAKAHAQLGRLLAAKAKREDAVPIEAVAELKTAVKLDPNDLQAAFELADIIKERIINVYDPDLAMDLFQKILKANPTLADVRLRYATWMAIGEIRLTVPNNQGRVSMDSAWTMESARHEIEKVLDQVPADSEQAAAAHFMIAHVFMKSGAWLESVREVDLLLSRFPDLPLDRKVQALGIKGHGYYRQGMFKEALAAFKEAYETTPNIRSLWDMYQAGQSLGGYPAGFPAKYRFPYRPEETGKDLPSGVKFRDIAPQLGVDKFAGAGPASWADYDGDGRFDLVACGCDTFCSLFHNDGKHFSDVTLAAGLGKVESGFGATWGDYDGDGRPDLYIARNGWNGPTFDYLLHNKGDGTFENVIDKVGISEPGSGFNVVWFDYNRDGWLDILVTNGVTLDPNINHLYRNKGDGTFENVTEQAGMKEEPRGGTIGVAVGDVDQDGWPDIFVHGRMRANKLYHNLGNGKFEEIAKQAGVIGHRRQNGYVAIFADMDADGDFDLFTVSLALFERVMNGYRSDYVPVPDDDLSKLYRNDGNLKFTDISEQSGFVYPIGTMAANVGDVNNDGYPDIYFGTGNPDIRRLEPNVLYMRGDGGRYVDRTRSAGVGNLGKGHGITFLDWDGDGDLDMFAEVGGFYHGDLWHSAFYLNETPPRNHFLEIALSQEGTNHLAVGSGVTVKAGKLTMYQEVTNGRGFGSSDPPVLHYGLGQNLRTEKLTIRWPDGTRVDYPPPPADKKIRIRKGDSSWTLQPPPS